MGYNHFIGFVKDEGDIHMVCIHNFCYELVEERKNGFNEQAFRERYSEILSRYDYIVGDWGYGQLRLKGFLMTRIKKQPLIRKLVHYRNIFMNIAILAVPILF